MRPQTVGRIFGIGTRLAGRAVVRTLEGPPRPAAGAETVQAARAQSEMGSAVRAKAQATGRASRGVVNGVGGFLRPFRRVGGTVWLEVMGVFFLLPVLVFSPVLWRTRMNWASGPDHRTFLSSAVVIAVFLYLGISSFWRAHLRSRS